MQPSQRPDESLAAIREAAVQIVLAHLYVRALYSEGEIDDDYCAAIGDLAWHALARK